MCARPLKIQTEEYSAEVRFGFREAVTVIYEENGRAIEFSGERGGQRLEEQVDLLIPAALSLDDHPRVLANLCTALKQLKFEYTIARWGKKQSFSEAEQKAAIAELRELGMIAEVESNSFKSVRLTRVPGWQEPAGFDRKKSVLRQNRLTSIARGEITPLVIVAKSDHAAI